MSVEPVTVAFIPRRLSLRARLRLVRQVRTLWHRSGPEHRADRHP
jgi:hypothetical protein